MDLLSLFSGKGIERVELPSRSEIPELVPKPSSLFRELRLENGTAYAQKYIEEDEREALKASTVPEVKHETLDAISYGTNLQGLAEVNNEDLTKIYKTYDFAYRPKKNLTIVGCKDEILSMIEHESVVIIQGVTGCGKSTQVPQFILDKCFKAKTHCNIVVTQPRRIAAISIAERVCKERNWTPGSLVGFQVGMFHKTSADTRLTYVTTGVLLRRLINRKNMLDYTHVIIDEVHERDQEMDFLLLVIRKFLRSNSRQVRVVLMSATFDAPRFSKYFSAPSNKGFTIAPIFEVPKKGFFRVTTYYLCELDTLGDIPEVKIDEPKVSNRMMEICARLINVFDQIDENSECDAEEVDASGAKPRHSTLIFLPGIWEIEEMHTMLSNQNTDVTKWDIVVLHSSITHEEQKKIFIPPPKGHRRIILSTNIAESSITIDDIKYVIDFCLTKQLVTDPMTNFQCLELTWASKANCDQRAGRTGRLMDGRVYRLVPKDFFNHAMPNEGDPEITRAPLENIVLNTKLLDMGEPKAILALAIDPPDLGNLERTILLLKEVGGLVEMAPGEWNRFDGKITALGRIMAALPIEIHIAKLIALGHVFSVLRECIIMGASMAVKSIFSSPFQKRMEAYNAKVRWADQSCSDCIAFLHAHRVWTNKHANNHLKNRATERNWAQRNFIQLKMMYEVDILVTELTRRLRTIGIVETVGPNKVVRDALSKNFVMKVVIAGAFYPNYFARCSSGGQGMEVTQLKMLGGLDPTKTIYLQGWKPEQPGLLYARSVQEHFKDCVSSQFERIVVKFDGSSRVYVHFNDSCANRQVDNKVANMPGKISLSVYKALKKRSLNIPITIPLLDIREARNRAEKLGIDDISCDVLMSRSQISNQLLGVHPKLPSFQESTIQLKIKGITDPGSFWVHRNDRSTWAELEKIERVLNDSDVLMDFTKKPEIGSMVIALGDKNASKYFRAVVESFSRLNNEDIANILYIDHGWRKTVAVSSLKTLSPSHPLMLMPAIAFPCTLTNVRPSVKRNLEGTWSREATDIFFELTSKNCSLEGEIYSVVNGIVSMVLKVGSTEEKISVNQVLIDKGLADYCEEDYLSRYNHDMRMQSGDMEKVQRSYYENMQYDFSHIVETYPSQPIAEDCVGNVELRGPFSPLEVRMSSLAGAGMGKKVNVEGSSVNSVIVDHDPEDPHERLLIAGTVGQNPAGTNLTLRNTTLMPKFPGLTALLSLIFAPMVELRRSAKGTKYVGALCGLGYNTRTGQPLLPEHDMEIRFDTEITINDLQEINRMRHWMNMGIYTTNYMENQDEGDGAIVQCQKRIDALLMKLIEKPRNSQELVKVPNFERWGLYDRSLFMHPTKSPLTDTHIYQFHYALMLNDRDEKAEMMAAHMSELRRAAAGDLRLSDNIEIVCKLCDEKIFGRMSLRAHLYTKRHRDAEQVLGIQRIR